MEYASKSYKKELPGFTRALECGHGVNLHYDKVGLSRRERGA